MFDALTEKLQRTFKNLRGEGKLTEENVAEAVQQIRVALLEADVHFQVVKTLLENTRAKALGQEVMLALTPDQQMLRIVRDELVALLGGQGVPLRFASRPPSVFLIVGLQGSGKTTTTGKLGRWLSKKGHRPIGVSTDVYRPAARQQLSIIARDVGLPCWEGAADANPFELAKGARREANLSAYDVILMDTAGRLHIDEELMTELVQLKEQFNPSEILFIADAMLGQDAVRSAGEFHRRLGLTGVILTKMDGDARGGAALSIRSVTGAAIKFIGTGEKYDAFEPFHPDRIVSRVLGMGDVLSLIEKAEEHLDEKKAEALEQKLRRSEFTLEDFRDQLRQLRKMGPLEQIVGMLPQIGPLKNLPRGEADDAQLKRVEAIINSMTPAERANERIINGQRRKRIARGSGTSVQEVNRLLRQYAQMRRMMKSLGGGALKKLPRGWKGIKDLGL
jgi:signal recognition particle subunit SRP54